MRQIFLLWLLSMVLTNESVGLVNFKKDIITDIKRVLKSEPLEVIASILYPFTTKLDPPAEPIRCQERTIQTLDRRMNETLHEIRNSIPGVVQDVEDEILKDKLNKFWIGASNFMGMIFGILSQVISATLGDLANAGKWMQVTAQVLYGWGYWGPWFTDLVYWGVDCGLDTLDEALNPFVSILDLERVYPAKEERLAYRANTFLLRQVYKRINTAMKRGLYCVVRWSGVDSARRLSTLIDLFTMLGDERLMLTQKEIDETMSVGNSSVRVGNEDNEEPTIPFGDDDEPQPPLLENDLTNNLMRPTDDQMDLDETMSVGNSNVSARKDTEEPTIPFGDTDGEPEPPLLENDLSNNVMRPTDDQIDLFPSILLNEPKTRLKI